MLKLIFPATLLLACSPAVAQTQPPQQQQQAAAAQTKLQTRVICRDVGDIGSRLESHRVCMTAERWKQQEQDAKDATAADQQLGPH